MKKLHSCVMLPTEKANNNKLTIERESGELSYFGEEGQKRGEKYYQPQHLYFTSNKEIKEGDWYYNPNPSNRYHIFQRSKLGSVFSNKHKEADSIKNCKKIIATTANSLELNIEGLRLTQIPRSFLPIFVKAYNEGKPITEVELEYEFIENQDLDGEWSGIEKLKTTSNNEVIISVVDKEIVFKNPMDNATIITIGKDDKELYRDVGVGDNRKRIYLNGNEEKLYTRNEILEKLSYSKFRKTFNSTSGMFLNKKTSSAINEWIKNNL